MFGSPWLINDYLRISIPPLPLFLADDVSLMVWPSLISTYHGGAYSQISISFLALHGKYTNLSIYMVAAPTTRSFNVTICGHRVQRVKGPPILRYMYETLLTWKFYYPVRACVKGLSNRFCPSICLSSEKI